MQDNHSINKARALYYNLFANFFVASKESRNYFELLSLVNILKENPIDSTSGEALEKISLLLDSSSNTILLQEFDDLFHSPMSKKIRQTASYYDEGVESGKKRVEMIQFIAKTKIRRDEKAYFEYEDSIGFIFSALAFLSNEVAKGQKEYENTVHCIFESILNEFIDALAKDIYEHENAHIYKELMVVLHSFLEFERLYLDVSVHIRTAKFRKVAPSEKILSEEEMQRRARNKALREENPKEEQETKDIAYDVEVDI